MMSDHDIIESMHNGNIEVTPFEPSRLQPCSYDVTLSTSFALPVFNSAHVYDVAKDNSRNWNHVIMDKIALKPGKLILASTIETVTLDNTVAARLEGKSSLARLGIMVHTAGFVDAGFTGQLTLEISNLLGAPIWLRAHMPIAQLAFFRLDSPAEEPYQGKYQHQKKATTSEMHRNFT